MLKECHRRVEDQCDTLLRLVPHVAAHGSDAAAAEAAAAVVRYFDLAAPKHHADEENDLLPALFKAVEKSDTEGLQAWADRLQADHQALDAQWRALRAVLLNVMALQPATLDDSAVNSFVQNYRTHIGFEEGELFPMAQRLLSEVVLAQIGQSMRRRRGEIPKSLGHQAYRD